MHAMIGPAICGAGGAVRLERDAHGDGDGRVIRRREGDHPVVCVVRKDVAHLGGTGLCRDVVLRKKSDFCSRALVTTVVHEWHNLPGLRAV